jgi:4-aminobutyrate aminotransferase-like enzyme
VYLYDPSGRAYLDCVNNVAHVGHEHPRVVDAIVRQARVLNTNTRYLHERLVEYAERLVGTLPDPLGVCYLVCSGSEANELALRMARVATGGTAMVVLDGGYHGNTSSLVDVSPYKYKGAGGAGPPSWVHEVPLPDPYRGLYTGREAGGRYADHVREAASRAGNDLAGIIAEPLIGCGGQIVPPPGFLSLSFEHVKRAGGVTIADEVQVGFGRVGSHFWAFEIDGTVPDIVTMGKPIGNGHPMGAVVTTHRIAEAFANGMEYFNTFGGNPVSCAAGLAVLDVIRDEGLQANAERVGRHLLEGLRELTTTHEPIGDVRGEGLYVGIEIVRDRKEKSPDAALARDVVNRARHDGVLLSTDGPDHNVIKVKPPLPFSVEHADRLVDTVHRALTALRP